MEHVSIYVYLFLKFQKFQTSPTKNHVSVMFQHYISSIFQSCFNSLSFHVSTFYQFHVSNMFQQSIIPCFNILSIPKKHVTILVGKFMFWWQITKFLNNYHVSKHIYGNFIPRSSTQSCFNFHSWQT